MHRTDLPTRGRQEGTSLVELMVGIVAIVTILGSVISMTVQQSRLRKHDQELYLAFMACRNTMEQVRSLPFSTLTALHGSGFDCPDLRGNPGGLRAVPGDPDGLPGEISVVVDQNSGSETVYMVTLTVTWRGSMRESEFEMKTLLGERKIQ